MNKDIKDEWLSVATALTLSMATTRGPRSRQALLTDALLGRFVTLPAAGRVCIHRESFYAYLDEMEARDPLTVLEEEYGLI